MDLTNFVCIGNNRLEAYGSHMNFEMGFDNPELRVLITFDEFCKELDKGYENSKYIQIQYTDIAKQLKDVLIIRISHKNFDGYYIDLKYFV